MKYAGQVRSSGSLDYCSPIVDSREDAAARCFAARPDAKSCITMEARHNEDLGKVIPTHHGVEQHYRLSNNR